MTQPTQEDFDNLNLSIEPEDEHKESYQLDRKDYLEFVENTRSLYLNLKDIFIIHDGKSKKVQPEMKLINGEMVERRPENKLSLFQEELLRQIHYCFTKGYLNFDKDE